MTDWLVIDGVQPWDGRYELDFDGREFTTREWGWVKRLSGYTPLTIDVGDPEVIVVLAIIALHRGGRIQPDEAQGIFDRFQDVPFGAAITIETGQREEAETVDPQLLASSNGSDGSPGAGSKTSSASSEPTPDLSGIPDSATSGPVPVTSVR